MMRWLPILFACCSLHAQGLFFQLLSDSDAAAGASFTANTAVFDGSNDSMRQTAALTGLSDSKVITASFWVNLMGGDAAEQFFFVIHSGTSQRFLLSRTTGNKLLGQGRDSGGTLQLSFTSNTSLTSASGWKHVYVCIDLVNVAGNKVYFDGVLDSTTWSTTNNATIDLVPATSPRATIGGNNASTAASLLNGALAEFWFDNVYLDDVGAFASGGKPVSLGANGETPTGSAPAVYFSLVGGGDSWASDSSGNGNNFTVTGSLGTTTPP